MALDQSALLEVRDALRNADAADRIKQAAETIYQALIDAELTAVIGAAPHERTDSRTNQRNGSRARTLTTIAGDLELRIPKLRSGSFFPALLERRRRVDQCLFAVVMEAYLHGTSTRKVDDLVKALGADSGGAMINPTTATPGSTTRTHPVESISTRPKHRPTAISPMSHSLSAWPTRCPTPIYRPARFGRRPCSTLCCPICSGR